MNLFYIDTVDSTNKYAKEHMQELADMTVVYTYNQTAGRGRLDRKWNFAGEDNIYASIILKPADKMHEQFSNLTQYLCLVLAEVMEEYGVIPKIKWPNDILINSKKISGILAEGVTSGDSLMGIVLGFGVNLNAKKEILDKIDKPATSLNIEAGYFIDKKIFLTKVLNKFCLRYDEFINKGFRLIREDFIKRACFLNNEVTVKVFDKNICGLATNITSNGALEVTDKENKKHTILMGDIL